MNLQGYAYDRTEDLSEFAFQVWVLDPLQVIRIHAREASLPSWRSSPTIPLEALDYDELVSALKRHIRHEPGYAIDRMEIEAFIIPYGISYKVRHTNDLITPFNRAILEGCPWPSLTVDLVLRPAVSDAPAGTAEEDLPAEEAARVDMSAENVKNLPIR